MSRGPGAEPVAIYLEIGRRRVFASALDWPGWSRSGKSEAAALESLAAAAPRYARVARRAGLSLPEPLAFETLERVFGSGATDFGVPDREAAADRERLQPSAARRLGTLLEAAWAQFDATLATAPATLRKGPRGGGRDRDAVADHVQGAEAGYARAIGVAAEPPGDPAALRRAILAWLEGTAESKKWSRPYAARRIAWHVLDHAWEIEDRTESA
jgi:hypothetical protein